VAGLRNLLIAAVAALSAATGAAQQTDSFQSFPASPSPEALRNLPNPRRSVDALGGRCEHLEFGGLDETTHCRALLTKSHYDRGQSIQFWLNGPTGEPAGALSFFGFGEKLSGETTTLAVELVTIVDGTPPAGRKAQGVGTCEFGKFAAVPVRVTCTAKVDGRTYGGTFLTDGTPPERQRD